LIAGKDPQAMEAVAIENWPAAAKQAAKQSEAALVSAAPDMAAPASRYISFLLTLERLLLPDHYLLAKS